MKIAAYTNSADGSGARRVFFELIKRLKEKGRVFQKLPQIDCGCCGCPTCKAFAEDYVRDQVKFADCVMLARKVGL